MDSDETINNNIENDLLQKYIVIRQHNIEVIVMRQNKFINASHLCREHGKIYSNWKKQVSTKNEFHKLATLLNVTQSCLSIRIYKSNINRFVHGIYIHPVLCVYVARWISQQLGNAIVDIVGFIDSQCHAERLLIGKVTQNDHASDEEIIFTAINDKNEKYHELKQHIKPILDEYETLYIRGTNATCGICLEHIYLKNKDQQYFGHLSHCNHVFCSRCIILWHNESKKTCPICRTNFSNIVISRFMPNKK
ncbi:KilA-N/RING finger protein [Sea otter poxvirus]|uniref:KilA-N/RING finger protein n=1 Tax=Sea otter poxvirus TaxID=1416741 RepID=A0A2U9QHG5_9POXV|nr:KilA-N/RING finger protein [Sea otter poxvirus]AWU47050.1 KilA-N/RING finger protein [Sea otter poxvirus]